MPTWNRSLGEARVCVGTLGCLSFAEARAAIRVAGGWRHLLPSEESILPAIVEDNRGENCPFCNGSVLSDKNVLFDRGQGRTRHAGIVTEPEPHLALADYYCFSASHPQEAWNVAGSVGRIADLPDAQQLDFQVDKGACTKAEEPPPLCPHTGCPPAPMQCRSGFVPSLIPRQTIDVASGWRSFRRGGSPPFYLPCSSARGEDAALLRSFFTDADGRPIRGGSFLEIGGVDGLIESNTFVLERCFGWRGVLIEGHPLFFERLRRNRPASLSLRLAACSRRGWVKYDQWTWTGAKVKSAVLVEAADSPRQAIEQHLTECSPVGERLVELGIHRLSLISIDVEGAELTVVQSLLDASPRLSLGVVLVEVRADGQRRAIMAALLGAGMRYVGQLRARGSEKNDVIDDCFVNATHLRLHFPHSRAAKALQGL